MKHNLNDSSRIQIGWYLDGMFPGYVKITLENVKN